VLTRQAPRDKEPSGYIYTLRKQGKDSKIPGATSRGHLDVSFAASEFDPSRHDYPAKDGPEEILFSIGNRRAVVP
jgi:hypothetical protein